MAMTKEELFDYMVNVKEQIKALGEEKERLENLVSKEIDRQSAIVEEWKAAIKSGEDADKYHSDHDEEWKESKDSVCTYKRDMDIIGHALKAMYKSLCKAAMASICTELLKNEKAFSYPSHYKKFKDIMDSTENTALEPLFIESYKGWDGRNYNRYLVEFSAYVSGHSKSFQVRCGNESVDIEYYIYDEEGKLKKDYVESYVEKVELEDPATFYSKATYYLTVKERFEEEIESLDNRIKEEMKKFELVSDNSCVHKYFYF